MIYLGPAGIPTTEKTIEGGIKKLNEIGLNAMEVQFVRGVNMNIERAKKISSLAKEYGIKLSAHAPYYINLSSDKAEVRKKSIENILATLKVANSLNADLVVVHAGYYSKIRREKTTELILSGLEECKKAMDKLEIETYIGLETMGRKSCWGTMEEIEVVCKRIDGVIPVIDFPHIHARENGSLTNKNKFLEIIKRYEKILNKFLHSHFYCIEYGDKGEKKHKKLDAKEPDFSLFVPVLKELKYDVTIISESPILEIDSLAMKRMIK
ncbi:MAG: TIM barrel protein [Candidatus Thermoplasmatota archaeon]